MASAENSNFHGAESFHHNWSSLASVLSQLLRCFVIVVLFTGLHGKKLAKSNT